MKIDNQRADFEAWSHGRCELHLVNPAGRYSSAITQFAWEAYQAGRAAGIRDGRAAAYDSASRMEQMREDGL